MALRMRNVILAQPNDENAVAGAPAAGGKVFGTASGGGGGGGTGVVSKPKGLSAGGGLAVRRHGPAKVFGGGSAASANGGGGSAAVQQRQAFGDITNNKSQLSEKKLSGVKGSSSGGGDISLKKRNSSTLLRDLKSELIGGASVAAASASESASANAPPARLVEDVEFMPEGATAEETPFYDDVGVYMDQLLAHARRATRDSLPYDGRQRRSGGGGGGGGAAAQRAGDSLLELDVAGEERSVRPRQRLRKSQLPQQPKQQQRQQQVKQQQSGATVAPRCGDEDDGYFGDEVGVELGLESLDLDFDLGAVFDAAGGDVAD